MAEFLLVSENIPFTIALAVMMILAALEVLSNLMGLGIFSFIDSFLPDVDIDLDPAADSVLPDAGYATSLSRMLAWFYIGEVPAIILLIVFLTGFGTIGLCFQRLLLALSGTLFPSVVVGTVAFFSALPLVRGLGGILSKIILKTESEAVSEKSFIGRIAVVTLGQASAGKPAQAKLKDRFGHTHYVMVEPESEHKVFKQGATVLLIERQGVVFKAIFQDWDGMGDENLMDL